MPPQKRMTQKRMISRISRLYRVGFSTAKIHFFHTGNASNLLQQIAVGVAVVDKFFATLGVFIACGAMQ